MADIMIDDQAQIQEVVAASSRLKYLLMEKYQVKTDAIDKIRVDSDNYKIDVHIGEKMLRFKAKGTDQVLAPDPESGNLQMMLDPALAMGIYEICGDFA